MNMDLSTLWDTIDKGGTIAIALFVIIAFLRGWIVPRWAYVELKDHLANITKLADRATELAERTSLAVEELKRHRRG